MPKFLPGDTVILSKLGLDYLLPFWKHKGITGTVETLVTENGDIIGVRRDDTKTICISHSGYWDRTQPESRKVK